MLADVIAAHLADVSGLSCSGGLILLFQSLRITLPLSRVLPWIALRHNFCWPATRLKGSAKRLALTISGLAARITHSVGKTATAPQLLNFHLGSYNMAVSPGDARFTELNPEFLEQRTMLSSRPSTISSHLPFVLLSFVLSTSSFLRGSGGPRGTGDMHKPYVNHMQTFRIYPRCALANMHISDRIHI